MAEPTHTLTVKKKPEPGEKTYSSRVGVAWSTPEGWITIKLDPCVVLTDREDIYINLYPIDKSDLRKDDGDKVPF